MAITNKELESVHGEEDVQAIYQEVRLRNDFIGFTQQFMCDEDGHVARNAFWTLTKATDKELAQLQVMLNELIDLSMQTDNSSVRRLSLNIVERLKMSEQDPRADFLDFCLDRMTHVEEFPGTQTLCMKLAFRMCKFYPELMDEFMRIIETMDMDFYKPAIKSLRNRILSGKIR
ncbi:MAG: hypothetical protein GXY64_01590 [Bacteroidales bacterium]|nr:hypothetical protein [Bacteroidales bacterium]